MLSEEICICTCGMYLRVPEGSIWRLPSDQVSGVRVPIVFHVPGTRGISPGYSQVGVYGVSQAD